MAALTITAANTTLVTTAENNIGEGIAGGTITVGQPVYKDSTDSEKIKIADADASAAASTVVGISLHAALAGQPIKYLRSGRLSFGAILTVAQPYFLGDTAGSIIPFGDLNSGDYTVLLGFAISTSVMQVQIVNSGVALTA